LFFCTVANQYDALTCLVRIKSASGPVSGGWVLTLFVPWTMWNITFSEAKGAHLHHCAVSLIYTRRTASPWRMNFFRIDTPLVRISPDACLRL
jgi:hypothetical protein